MHGEREDWIIVLEDKSRTISLKKQDNAKKSENLKQQWNNSTTFKIDSNTVKLG